MINKKKYVLWLCGVAAVSVLLTICIGVYDSSHWVKTYQLNEQRIGSVMSGSGYDCIDCLIMDVQDVWCTSSGVVPMNHTFFFAGEHELMDELSLGDLIDVRWVRYSGETFIRGVKKHNG